MRKITFLLTALLLHALLLFSQVRTITGQVKDEKGEPIPLASIKVKGSKTGVAADANGNFKIEASGNAVFIISATGFQPIQVRAGTSGVISATLASTQENLSEVVVTALGIKRTKNDLPYAAQQVSAAEITKTRTDNFATALSGKVAGLTIKTNNTMGGSTDIILRGFKSITGSNQALIVVDGVPVNNANVNTSGQTQGGAGYDYGNTGADLNPDDIESINVLKGAASTALYGSRASNGVILITTKKGKKGLGVVVNIGGSTGSMDKSTWIKYQHEYGAGYYDPNDNTYSDSPPSPDSHFAYYDANGDGVPDLVVPTADDASYGQKFNPTLNVYQWDAFDPTSRNYLKATPWVAAKNDPTTFFENPWTISTSIQLTGGSDKGSFKLGYTKNENKGILPNSKLSKDLLNFSADYKITDRLIAAAAVNFSRTSGLGRYGTGYDAYNVATNFREWWQMNVDIKDQKAAYERNSKNVTWNMANPPDDAGPAYWDNPYFTRYKSYESDERFRTISSLSLTYNIRDWLNILGRVSLDSYDQLQEERNGYSSINVAGYTRANQTFREYNYDFIASVNKNITGDLNLKAVAGANLRRDFGKSIWASTNGGLIIPGIFDLANSVNPITAPVESDSTVQVGGVFASATLNYKNLLVLDLTARQDKSSTLPAGNNSYFYPSASGGFVFSKLLAGLTWLNQGKLRLNYAEVGKDAPFNYLQDSYLQPTPFGSAPLFSVKNGKRNPGLRPEKTRSYEAGLEMSLFKNRVGFDVTWYKTNTIDEIIPVTISASTGYTSQIINAGNVENRGIEVSLNLVPVKTGAFTWNMNINWARNRNKVLSLNGSTTNILLGRLPGGITENAAVGQPFGTLRGSDFVYTNGQKTVDADGYYLVSQSANNQIGNINPDWTGGINNTFSYKNLSFGFLIDVRKGGSVYSVDQWFGQATGLTANTVGLNDKGHNVRDLVVDGGGVLLPGVTANGKVNTQYAQLTGLHGYGVNNFPNIAYVYDAGYVKLREANITYSIPRKMISRMNPIKGIDISLYGRNLWIIHKNLPDADPEDGSSSGNITGFQVGSYPTYRTYGLNLKFQF